MAIIRSDAYTEDTIDQSKRKTLAEDIWEAGHQVTTKHPEARVIMSVVWTPRPDDHPKGVPYDDSHTAFVSGEKEVSIEDLERFLQTSIAQLVNLYRRVARRDPTIIDIMSKEK